MVGGVIAMGATQGTKAQLKAAMREGQVDVEQIVREQFKTELAGSAIFPSIVSEGGDAEVRLEVGMFGFSQPHGFSGKLVPVLGVIGSLTRKDGTVLWKSHDHVSPLNGQTPAHTLEEYLQNPQYMREAFTIAAKIVSEGLVKHMRQD
jgi:hypothetical protein